MEHGVPISAGPVEITQRLDARRVVCVCHVAQGGADTRAGTPGTGCSTSVLPQRNSGLLGWVSSADQSVMRTLLYVLR